MFDDLKKLGVVAFVLALIPGIIVLFIAGFGSALGFTNHFDITFLNHTGR